MKDVQKSKPRHNLKLDKVGIRNLKYPLIVLDRMHKHQNTIANINVYVDLPNSQRGTHMSRFIEILEKHANRVLTVEALDELTFDFKRALNCKSIYLEISFPYFIEKVAPVSKKNSLLNYSCKIIRMLKNDAMEYITVVRVPITTLCPCSKEISDAGAHNQRGYVILKVKLNEFVWIEDLIKFVEDASSCEIYPLLKRKDEKFVTERAYNNPKFVEDIVREIAFRLKDDRRIAYFKLECESYETIHNHNAYACISSKKSME